MSIGSGIRTVATAGLVVHVAGFAAASAAAALTGEALVEQCAAHDWNRYVLCQRRLLEARTAGNYCVPLPENAARYQYEFLEFMHANDEGLRNSPADAAAAAFFSARYPCS